MKRNSGKTNTALHIAETIGAAKTFILTKPITKSNFIDNIFKYDNIDWVSNFVKDSPLGAEYLQKVIPHTNRIIDSSNNNRSQGTITPSDLKKAVAKIFKAKGYETVGYGTFANQVSSMTDDQIKHRYSNNVIIIDEIHHLHDTINGEALDIGVKGMNTLNAVKKIVSIATNVRIVGLTATPMFDKYEEFEYIIDLFMTNEGYTTNNDGRSSKTDKYIRFDTLPDDTKVLSEESREFLLYFSQMFVSYINNPPNTKFPRQLGPNLVVPGCSVECINDPDLEILPNKLTKLKLADIVPVELETKFKGLHALEFILAPMRHDGIQYKTYMENTGSRIFDYFKIDTSDETIDFSNQNNKFYMNLQLSNIAIPAKPSSVIKTTLTTDNMMHTHYDKMKIYNVASYDPDFNNFPLQGKKLSHSSSKIWNLIELIQKQPGRIIVYSNFIKTGIIPAIMALECIGYSRYASADAANILDFVGVKNRPTFDKNVDEYGYAKRYAVLTGDKNLSPQSVEKVERQLATSNKQLLKCKVFFISSAATEGIDFKGVEHVHILEPWHNLSRISQAVGRAVRLNSHVHIEDPKRHETRIYIHAAIVLNNKHKLIHGVDLHIYTSAIEKMQKIQLVSKVIREGAMDCGFDTEIIRANKMMSKNVVSNNTGYFKWDIDDCDCYKFNDGKDENEYNVELATRLYMNEIKVVAAIIKKSVEDFTILFRHDISRVIFGMTEKSVMSIDIEDKKIASERLIDAAITYMINEPVVLFTSKGIQGKLVVKYFAYHGKKDLATQVLLFEPVNANHSNLTLYERTFVNNINYHDIQNLHSKIKNEPSSNLDVPNEVGHDTSDMVHSMNSKVINFASTDTLEGFDEFKLLTVNKGFLEGMSTELLSNSYKNPPEFIAWFMALEMAFPLWNTLFIYFNYFKKSVPPEIYTALRKHHAVVINKDNDITDYYEVIEKNPTKAIELPDIRHWEFDLVNRNCATYSTPSAYEWFEAVVSKYYTDIKNGVTNQGPITYIPSKFHGSIANDKCEFKTHIPSKDDFTPDKTPSYSYLGNTTKTVNGSTKLALYGTQYSSSSLLIKSLISVLLESIAIYTKGAYNPWPITLEQERSKKINLMEDFYKIYENGHEIDHSRFKRRPIEDILNDTNIVTSVKELATRIALHEYTVGRTPYSLDAKPVMVNLQKKYDYHHKSSFPTEAKSVAFNMAIYYNMAIEDTSGYLDPINHRGPNNLLYLSIYQLICLRYIPLIVDPSLVSNYIRIQN